MSDFSGNDSKSMFQQMMSFDRMIGTKLVKIIYFIGLLLIPIYALITFVGALGVMSYDFTLGLGTMVGAVVLLAVGTLFWRLICELYLLFFNIHDFVSEIRDIERSKLPRD